MKKIIGYVGVDSGQLLLTDPCYLKDWKNDSTDEVLAHTIYQDTDGKLWQYCYGGKTTKVPGKVITPFPGNYETPVGQGTPTPNDLIASGAWKPTKYADAGRSSFYCNYSYSGACAATMGDAHGGQLKYAKGHDGAGVAVRTGYGDGLYPVVAHYNREGRVRKIEVVFIE
jgi:hypothetical protein